MNQRLPLNEHSRLRKKLWQNKRRPRRLLLNGRDKPPKLKRKPPQRQKLLRKRKRSI